MSHKKVPELMGLQEIGQLAGVTPQAVANWVQRKPDFPRPIATLASGSVWDGATIREWLAPNRAVRTSFVPGRIYTLGQIAAAFGGETQSYLPQRDGCITCGRFTIGMNPDLPYEVLVGDLPRVRRKAELLANQEEAIPVFLKQGADRWLFHGRMRCAGYVTDRNLIRDRELASGRTGLAGVLRLADVE
jgi:predicted DNA-binding transcriptional regulator AlpA